jgi:hypothetical protein
MDRRTFLQRSTVASRRLRDWFAEIIQTFPPLNGPLSKEELPEDEATATDYSIGKVIIYASFAWSKESEAYEAVFALAQKHRLGFFNVSSNDEEVWLPNNERLLLAHCKQPPSLLTKLKERFRPNPKPN